MLSSLVRYLISISSLVKFHYALTPTQLNPPHSCSNYGLCEMNPDAGNDTQDYLYCPAGHCVCLNGTTGTDCATVEDQCADSPCEGGNSVCMSKLGTYSCSCQAGWAGENCTIPSYSICASSPCFNGGECISADNTTYTCNCIGNYIEPRCQYSNPCEGSNKTDCNSYNCTPMWNGENFKCECGEEWNGRKCFWNRDTYDNNENYLNMGCYAPVNMDDTSKFDKLAVDNKMTVAMCKDLMIKNGDISYIYFMVSGQNCYISKLNYLNESNPYKSSDWYCNSNCPGSIKEKCGVLGGKNPRVLLFSYNHTTSDINDCLLNSSICGADLDRGFCVDENMNSGINYSCVCKSPYTGSNCEIDPVPPCDPSPCQNNATCAVIGNTFKCSCVEGFIGEKCQYLPQCGSTLVCQYGGTCIENNNGTAYCLCNQYYEGNDCSEINICEYANPCINGTCSKVGTGIDPAYKCKCNYGYTGVNCETEINMCMTKPCQYNGTCTASFMNYQCACVVGSTGKSCEINIPDCVKTTNPDNGIYYYNQCITRDSKAVCIDLINGFKCNCSEQWTGDDCRLNVLIKDVLMTIYGEVNLDMIPMLEDLMKSPAMIKDMVPFIIGMLDDTNRTELSWNYEDMFEWATFEEKVLDLQRDIFRWNDVVLGNCFTFNHHEQNLTYLMRSSGPQGGFRTLMKVGQNEFAPWSETAAIMVFIHNREEYIFSESVRYNAEPKGEMNLYIADARFSRLDGRYGTCVYTPDEVHAYYYEGMYTTDGCLRSCYQDMVQEDCGCMDPRYPMPGHSVSCRVTDMGCIDDAVADTGDPSTWESCVCPLPCANQQYSVQWTRSISSSPIVCKNESGTVNSSCLKDQDDMVLISVVLPRLQFSTYAETPAMDFNRFISNLGGLLGVLMGVCIISFIEIVFLILLCCRIIVSGK